MTSRRVVVDAVKRAAFAATLKDDPRAKAWTGAAWPISQAEGDFETKAEVMQVDGIGEKTLESIRDDITVGGE